MDSKRDIRNKKWLSKWSQLRRMGFMRYWTVYGVLYFALSFGIILTAVNLFSHQLPIIEKLLSEKLGINIGIALACGMVLSSAQWINNELRFRRLGSRYPNAVRSL